MVFFLLRVSQKGFVRIIGRNGKNTAKPTSFGVKSFKLRTVSPTLPSLCHGIDTMLMGPFQATSPDLTPNGGLYWEYRNGLNLVIGTIRNYPERSTGMLAILVLLFIFFWGGVGGVGWGGPAHKP